MVASDVNNRATFPEKENTANSNTEQSRPDAQAREASCLAGIARCAIRTGEIQRGMQVAIDLGDPKVLADSALLLEKLKQLLEAAALHEKAGNSDKAASLYIQVRLEVSDCARNTDRSTGAAAQPHPKSGSASSSKSDRCTRAVWTNRRVPRELESGILHLSGSSCRGSSLEYILCDARQSHEFEKAAPLMNGVNSPGLLLAFAKAKEEQGCLADAVEAYRRAKHYQAAVNIWVLVHTCH